ncbi:MAG: T9SS type A sorting domain-containing protein, partial [Paludibacter sp.]|nr:T9SS type A sorting domain-containing protein [Paludibacter sp.]
LKCKVSENGDTVTSAPIAVTVVDQLIIRPVISDISFSTSMPFNIHSTQTPEATVNTTDVQYVWSTADGTLTNPLTASPTWNLPDATGIYSVSLTVTNSSGSSTFSKSVLVKDFSVTAEPTPLIYYSFNGDTKNSAQDNYHAVSVNAVSTIGANGIVNAAYQFPSSSSYIYTPNEPALNFQDKIAVSFWVKPDVLPNNEQFILSHGSWEERYKISVTPDKKVRWTVKTNHAVVDVDADTVLQMGKFDHYTAVYTGYSSELYRNGKLSAFKAQTGLIQTTAKSLTIARKDEGTSDYNFRGTVDEVRIYNADLPQSVIQLLPTTFKLKAGIEDTTITNFTVYPNPFSSGIHINLPTGENIAKIEVFDLVGRKVYQATDSATNIHISFPNGFYLLRVTTDSGKSFQAKLIKKD